MTISYNWLLEYFPLDIRASPLVSPAEMSRILTAIGLEVEQVEDLTNAHLDGLIIGEVITCEKHPDADKLKITTVSINNGDLLNIVCGANNVAAGQKVIIAPVGVVLHPRTGGTVTIKKAMIRGVLSEGMICAEDEIGIGNDHSGIMIMPEDSTPGMPVKELFKITANHIFEIGLTPNRIDAMSHIGVAKDVCAFLSHHQQSEISPVLPYNELLTTGNESIKINIVIENESACKRYSGIAISGITVSASPAWLQENLISIGVKPINNIVDITNFILHESGQPLHAFDADKIKGERIIVRSARKDELFTTLDGKTRKLNTDDLVIADEKDTMCLAGVYGGIESSVTNATKNIFIESAWFDPAYIRKTSIHHDLRTDAAARFEKGTDISNMLKVLQRAAMMIKELAGGEIASRLIDIYPSPLAPTKINLTNEYLKKVSGKIYGNSIVKNILKSLGFNILSQTENEIVLEVPFSKPDVKLPADLVEEIMRIDGLDSIQIPETITIAPAKQKNLKKYQLKEKIADYLVGLGFYEVFTNSITNSRFYNEDVLSTSVKMLNSLSTELNIMRPQMMQGGLQAISHNINRKNTDLRFFEFGKTYASPGKNMYMETGHLSLYVSGNLNERGWKAKEGKTDIYYLKGAVENVLSIAAIKNVSFSVNDTNGMKNAFEITSGDKVIGFLGEVNESAAKQFDINAPVFYADLLWDEISVLNPKDIVQFEEISKYPAVHRDLSVVVDKQATYADIKDTAVSAKINELKSIQLFDIFESDKLGADKKAMAVSFTFSGENRTLTDGEIEGFMEKIIHLYTSLLNAEIRK